MIVEPEVPMEDRIAAARTKLAGVSVGDWTQDMGNRRKLSERQVLYGLLAAVDRDEYRDTSPIAERVVKLVEDRLK